MSFLGFAGDLQSSFQSVQNLKSVFDMDALKDKIEAEEKEQDKVTENSKKKVDEVSYEKRGNNSSNNPGDVPIVSSASLLSPAEAKKLKSFSTKALPYFEYPDLRTKGFILISAPILMFSVL